MLAEIFLLVITFYLLYRFVFNFLVPVVRTTRHVKQQFRNMQDAAGDQPRQEPRGWAQSASGAQQRHSSTKGAAGDYIDFEEIRK